MKEGSKAYYIINKPANMVSQFVSSHDVVLLGDLDFTFPEGVHAIGRLDNHSEGLLILTTDKSVTKKLFQGAVPHTRKYLVQVRKTVTPETIEALRNGISIQIKGGGYYTTTACHVEPVSNPFDYILQPPVVIEYEPSSWLLISLTEGKFHQVRKMVDAVGHRCKRLIRVSIEDLTLGDLKPGEVKEIEEKEFFRLLKIEG
jgi:23S rRNA pseudouridine2457 synthase